MKNFLKRITSFTGLFLVLGVLCFSHSFYSCLTPAASQADKQNYAEDDSQYKRKYEITFDEGEKPLRYGYHYVVSTVPEGFRVRVFHPDKKTLIEEKTYSTPSLTLLHGQYKSFWDDGSIREQGLYQYGRKHGLWLECEPGKGKATSGPYVNERKEGSWTQIDTNGLIESIYNWHDGMRHGKFFLYDSNGMKINEGIYRSDTLVGELVKQVKLQKPYLSKCQGAYSTDVYACTESTLMQKVYAELKYPATARQMKIEGNVLVQWDVMADGTVQHLRVPQALSDEIEKECLRIFSNMPAWIPALKDGKPVKVDRFASD